MRRPVTISRGENSVEAPWSDGNAFSQSTTKRSRKTIKISGMQCLYGSSERTLLLRSLITRMARSMSPTCSRAAVVLTGTSRDRSSRGLNSISIKHILTRKPPLLYSRATVSRLACSCVAVRLRRNSIVSSFMPLDRVTKNGRPFTNITSAVRITSRSRS